MFVIGNTLGISIHVFGPETHMTAIVSMALGKRDIPLTPRPMNTTANFLLPTGGVRYTWISTFTKALPVIRAMLFYCVWFFYRRDL